MPMTSKPAVLDEPLLPRHIMDAAAEALQRAADMDLIAPAEASAILDGFKANNPLPASVVLERIDPESRDDFLAAGAAFGAISTAAGLLRGMLISTANMAMEEIIAYSAGDALLCIRALRVQEALQAKLIRKASDLAAKLADWNAKRADPCYAASGIVQAAMLAFLACSKADC